MADLHKANALGSSTTGAVRTPARSHGRTDVLSRGAHRYIPYDKILLLEKQGLLEQSQDLAPRRNNNVEGNMYGIESFEEICEPSLVNAVVWDKGIVMENEVLSFLCPAVMNIFDGASMDLGRITSENH